MHVTPASVKYTWANCFLAYLSVSCRVNQISESHLTAADRAELQGEINKE